MATTQPNAVETWSYVANKILLSTEEDIVMLEEKQIRNPYFYYKSIDAAK